MTSNPGRGEPCARCGLKPGAHTRSDGGPHPRACVEWLTPDDLREDAERAFDSDAPDWSND